MQKGGTLSHLPAHTSVYMNALIVNIFSSFSVEIIILSMPFFLWRCFLRKTEVNSRMHTVLDPKKTCHNLCREHFNGPNSVVFNLFIFSSGNQMFT